MAGSRPKFGCAAGWAGALVAALCVAAGCQGVEGPVVTSRGAGAESAWQPSSELAWQIQLSGEVDTSFDVDLYVVDLDVPTATFDALRSAGRAIVCFFSAGSLEPWRADADRFPPYAVGEPMADYPDETWLDIRDPQVQTIMLERIVAAAARGCDGVQPANADGYLHATGFALTLGDQLDYDRRLAAAARQVGLAIGLADGDAALAEGLVDTHGWAFAVGCVLSGCSDFESFLAAGKPVFAVEFGDEAVADAICPRAAELGLSAIVKRPEFDAFRIACP